jgi:hypothetical protein
MGSKRQFSDDVIAQRIGPVQPEGLPSDPDLPAGSPDTLIASRQEGPHPGEHQEADNSLELCFLRDVQAYPDSGIAARYKRLGISVRQGQKIKAYLAAEGLIEEEKTRTVTGKLLRIRLTEKGRQLLPQR